MPKTCPKAANVQQQLCSSCCCRPFAAAHFVSHHSVFTSDVSQDNRTLLLPQPAPLQPPNEGANNATKFQRCYFSGRKTFHPRSAPNSPRLFGPHERRQQCAEP